MSIGRRVAALFKDNGAWAVHIIVGLTINRIKLSFLRMLLGEPTIYFQSPPRILGRRMIRFGPRFACGRSAWIEAVGSNAGASEMRLKIGADVVVSDYFHVAAARSVTIGDNALIGSGVLITDHGHGSYGADGVGAELPPNRRPLHVKGPVSIGKNVWLGDGVCVLSGVSIGDNAVIAANTVVRESVPANCVYGSTAQCRPIRLYDPETARWKGARSEP